MLRTQAGWVVNDKRIERIWRREGLKVPAKQPKRGRLWLSDGSCVRMRAERPNHVWSYDFVEDRTHEGRKYRMLNIIDEFTHECLAIRIDRRLNSTAVIDVLSDLVILRGVPEYVRSDNGPEFIARAVQDWIRTGLRPSAQRRLTSHLAALGRMASSRALTHVCVMNCLMAKSSTRSRKRGSLSRAGDAITTRSARTGHWD